MARPRSPSSTNQLLPAVLGLGLAVLIVAPARCEMLLAGFAHRDITPDVKANPVWLAGYGPGRQAESVHDPIFARAMAVSDGKTKLAVVSLDLVGLQYQQVLQIRKKLTEFDYVLVASTHNHEAPDVVGLWGPTVVQRGVDRAYLKLIVERTVDAVKSAGAAMQQVTARYGEAADANLVKDSRKPYVKDDVLKTLTFYDAEEKPAGVLLKWSVHPEAMGSRNKALTADFPTWMLAEVREKLGCPVVFVVGAIGGLLAPPGGGLLNKAGVELRPGQFEFAEAYGRECGKLALRSVAAAKPISLTPFAIHSRRITIPVSNLYYRAARAMKVLTRSGYEWTGDANEFGPLLTADSKATMAIETEIAFLRLGELGVPCIPGEIYPELVLDKIVDQAEANVDFPDAEKELTVIKMMPTKKWLLIGLANDEVGYILPKRQWDQKAPFAYNRTTSQYGEINSCGPDVARILLNALKARVNESNAQRLGQDGAAGGK